jgi:uncharacterized protein YdeI (YjbR/CyaY-like superfamily)
MNPLPALPFASPADWETWLAQHHGSSPGIWLQFYKKGSGIPSVTYPEALDAALCYGWIDGQLKSGDDKHFFRKFTPRRPKSIWSKINIGHVDRLQKAGRMKPAGMKQVAAARADGRWDRAYDSQGNMEVPGDFMKALKQDKKALAFFETLSKSNTYAIAWRLQTAKKPETREKRMKQILEMLGKGEKFH